MITLFISIFMLMTLICALQVITRKNPVHAVLWLILSFFNSCAIMVLLNAEYIAMITLIVYVGAVVILFLFVVMLLDIDITAVRKKLSTSMPIVIIAAISFVTAIYYTLHKSTIVRSVNFPIPEKNMDATYMIAFNLYTSYLLEFQVAALILFLAMIGTISLILHKNSKSIRRQSISKQLCRNKNNSVELLDVKSNKGVKI